MRQILEFILIIMLLAPLSLSIGSIHASSSSQTYSVTFEERGLPNGTIWSVDLNGHVKNSTSSNITFQVTGETYLSFSIPNSGNYIPTPSQGQLLVNSSIIVNVTFALPFVKLEITKLVVLVQSSGTYVTELQPGNSYVVGVDVQNLGNINSLVEANETILFNGRNVASDVPIATVAPGSTDTLSFVWTPSSTGVYTFLVNVKGNPNISLSTSFPLYVGVSPAKTYNVSFVENGLAPGVQWFVTFDGTTKSTTNNTVTFQVPEGTYMYSVGNVTGYLLNNATGKLIVVNSSIVVHVYFLPLIFKPIVTLNITYNNQPVTQLKTNTTYSLVIKVKNEGNATGQAFVLILASQGSTVLLNKVLNYSLKPGEEGNSTFPISLNSTLPLSITLKAYSSTSKGEVEVYNISSQFTVIQQPITNKTSTNNNTTTTNTTETNTTKTSSVNNTTSTTNNHNTNTTTNNTISGTTNNSTTTTNNTTKTVTMTSNVSSTNNNTTSSSNTTLYIGIGIVVIIVVGIIIFLKRK